MSPKSETNLTWVMRVAIAISGFLAAASFNGLRDEVREMRSEIKGNYTLSVKNSGRLDNLEKNSVTKSDVTLYIREEFKHFITQRDDTQIKPLN